MPAPRQFTVDLDRTCHMQDLAGFVPLSIAYKNPQDLLLRENTIGYLSQAEFEADPNDLHKVIRVF